MAHNLEYNLKLNPEHFKHGMHEAEEQVEHLKEKFEGLGEVLAETLAVYASFEFLKEAAEEFMKTETNARKLAQAVGANGGLADDFKELREQQEKLEEIGIFDDDEIMKAQTYGLQHHLTIEEIKNSIPILTDWAAATRGTAKDVGGVEGAMVHLAKAMDGSDKLLKSLGFTYDTNKTKTENLATATELLKNHFEGMNEDLAKNTAEGQMLNFENKVKNLQKAIGEDLVAGFQKILPYIKNFIDGFKETYHWLQENSDLIKDISIVIGVTLGTALASSIGLWIANASALAFNTVATFASLVATDGLAAALYAAGIAGQTAWALITGGISLILVGIYEAYQHFEGFKKFLWGFGYAAKELFLGLGEIVQAAFDPMNTVKHLEASVSHFKGIGAAFQNGMQAAADDITAKKKEEEERKKKLENPYSKIFTGQNTAEKNEPAKPGSTQTAKENITINITKLVEKLELHALNVKEGAEEIRAEIALALQEALNSVKYTTK